MTKKIAVIAVCSLLTTAVLLTACVKKIAKIAPETTNIPAGKCDSITYSKHIEPIISQNCTVAGCHGPGGSQVSLGDYQSVKNYLDNGKLKKRVIDGDGGFMPPSATGLPQDKKDLVQCWINNGGKEQ